MLVHQKRRRWQHDHSSQRIARTVGNRLRRAALLERLETRALLTAAPIAEQFLVHETLSLEESSPSIAVVESSGDFVAAWTSFEEPGQDESGLGVYVQSFDAAGVPKSSRILVNQDHAGDQIAPQVAVEGTGKFIVVWQGPDEDGTGIYAQRYDELGNAQGTTVRVHDSPVGDQRSASVQMDSAGNAIIVWQSSGQDGDGTGIYARRYDSSGVLGDELLVNTTTDGDQMSPAMSLNRSTGDFIVVWEGEVTGDETSIEVFAQRFDHDATPIGSEIQVNTETLRDQVAPNVAMDTAGNFVVTWTSEGIPGSGSDVFAQRFSASGTPVDGEFRVNGTVLQGQRDSVVAMDADGDFMITWQTSHQDEFSWGIYGRSYDSSGLPLSTEFQVNTYAEQPQTHPALAANSQGQVVSLWLGLDEDHASAVHAQRYQLPTTVEDFSSVGTELVLANYLGLEDTSAAVAVNRDRDFFVVWQSYGEDGDGLGILGQRLDATGAPIGDAFVVNTTTTGNQTNPDVAMDRLGHSVVVWESADQDGSGHGIYAQRYDVSGNLSGPEILVNSTTDGSQRQPAVAMNPVTGAFVVVWQSPDDSLEGIYGQRFDADGNPVGGEFAVNQRRYLDQVSPAVSMNANGEFGVTWVSDHRSEFDLENDSEKSIFVQWYDSNGVASGDEQLVHVINKEFQAQEYPDIALDGNGNMIVIWQSITQDGSAWGVYGRQVLADKTLVGDQEFQINQTTAENQRRATVVSDTAGNFAVSWQSDLQDQSATAIVSRQYHADATPETDEMIVNTWEIGPQILPVMAMTTSGDYGVFWSGQGLSRSEGIHGRIYEEGYVPPPPQFFIEPLGDQFLVSEAAGLEQSFPAVAVVEQTGNYVAAWTSFEEPEQDTSGLGVFAQQFNKDGTPAGDRILVHSTFTTDDQSNPAVAVDQNGAFVVVWQSLAQDEDGWGIFAQQYDSDGSPVRDLIDVNQLIVGDQTHPAVAMDNAGNFVITWQGPGAGGNDLDIYARRFDSDGNALDLQEFPVNTTTVGNQSAATVALSRTSGQFVVGWQSEVLGEESEIDVEVLGKLYAFNAAADAAVVVDEFPVNTISAKDQVGPHAAITPDGAFVMAWTAEGQIGSGADVFARRFGSDGSGLDQEEFRVNETTQQGQQYPAVGIDSVGNLIVSWQSSHQDGFSWGVFAKVYDATGNVVAGEFQVNSNIQGPQTNPAIHSNSQGDAVVVWLGLDAQHKPAVHSQRYELPTTEASEFAVGTEGEVVLNNYVSLEEAPVAAAVDAQGNYVATWQSYGEDGSGLGVYARRFNAMGQPLGSKLLVNQTTAGNQSQPDVAIDPAGGFTIVWQSAQIQGSEYDIFARRFDKNGIPVGDEFQVNTTSGGRQEMPTVAINPSTGESVIVWQGPDAEGKGIFAQHYDAAGNPSQVEFQINAFTALDQVRPTVSMNATGEWAVAWVSDHRAVFDPTDTEKSIFVQWYDQTGAASGDEVLVHSIQPEFEAQEHADIAIDPNGDFILVWQSINQDGNTWGVFGRQFLADKTPVQPIEFQVNQTVLAPQRHPSVAADANGNFVVGWQSHAQDSSGPGVFARLYDASAAAQTDEFLVPTADQGPQTYPVITMTGNGNVGLFWTGHGTDRVEGAHGRVFKVLSLHPWTNPVNIYDVNGKDGVTAVDALVVVNELARNSVSDPQTGVLVAIPPLGYPPPFYDVNKDGKATARDALMVINQLARINVAVGEQVDLALLSMSFGERDSTAGAVDPSDWSLLVQDTNDPAPAVMSPSSQSPVSLWYDAPIEDDTEDTDLRDVIESLADDLTALFS